MHAIGPIVSFSHFHFPGALAQMPTPTINGGRGMSGCPGQVHRTADCRTRWIGRLPVIEGQCHHAIRDGMKYLCGGRRNTRSKSRKMKGSQPSSRRRQCPGFLWSGEGRTLPIGVIQLGPGVRTVQPGDLFNDSNRAASSIRQEEENEARAARVQILN